ncbi:MAG TPA: hypothetical protein VJR24_03470 [Gemmatimonadaceae bacterium]|nr:hypothetical protein [Gemmatimonadaceae bacterium]
MKTARCLITAVAVFALGACGADSAAGPQKLGQELVGTWSENTSVPGSFLIFTAVVSDTTVTGAGTYSLEGGGAGNLAVTGFITGSNILLQFAEDNGTTVHVNATLASHDQLNASLFTTSDPVPVTFSRLLRE